jgi:hypothetical protein
MSAKLRDQKDAPRAVHTRWRKPAELFFSLSWRSSAPWRFKSFLKMPLDMARGAQLLGAKKLIVAQTII